MKLLLIGAGGVGEAIATIAKRRDPKATWLKKIVISDYNISRLDEISKKLEDPHRFPTEQINARNKEEIIALAKKHEVDFILTSLDPSFTMTVFNAALEAGCNYMDMAASLSIKHPEVPYEKSHIKLGDLQFAKSKEWEEKGRVAIIGSGMDPGVTDVFARYAEKYMFDEINEISVLDGGNLYLEGHAFNFGFSIWTTIEECLNPPVIWEKDKGWYTKEPFSDPEIFYLPEGIGDVEMVNVEHEEVVLIPRYIGKGLKKVTFKYGLAKEFIEAMKYLRSLNLDRTDMKIKIGDAEISPREFLAKVAPNPARVGKGMKGKTCVGTWVKGLRDGLSREVFLYQASDNEKCVARMDCQVVVAQTAFSPILMLELLSKGIWRGVGVHSAEAFDPDPFIHLMTEYEFPCRMVEMESEYLTALEALQLKQPFLSAQRKT